MGGRKIKAKKRIIAIEYTVYFTAFLEDILSKVSMILCFGKLFSVRAWFPFILLQFFLH
jgi:hypothetical protein